MSLSHSSASHTRTDKSSSYDRTLIRGIVIAAYLGWIAFGAVSVLLPSADHPSQNQTPIHIAATSALAAFWALFAKQRSPLTFYVYIVFPCYFWDQVLVRAGKPLLQYVRRARPRTVAGLVLRGLLVVGALQSMVVSTPRTIAPRPTRLN